MIGELSKYNAGDILWLGDWSAPWIIMLAVLGLAILGLSLYDLKPLPPFRRYTLVGLRGLAYGLALVMLLEPAVDLKNVTKVKNNVAVLIDVSQSMELKASDEIDETRFELARKALKGLQIPETGEDEDHKYQVFTFGSSVDPTSREALQSLQPTQQSSDLTEALEYLGREFARTELGGVVIVSDGTDTGGIGARTKRGETLDEQSIGALASLGAPVNTLAAGQSSELKDVAIRRVKHDDFAFVHNKVAIDVDLQVVGFDGASLSLTLERDGRVIQTRDVAITAGESSYDLTFEFVPEQIGREIYTIRAPQLEDEVLYENNVAHFVQKVIRDKIRVLQVVGRPSWDERFLRRLLKQNPNIDLISFFILRTAQNPQLAPQSELSLIPFPTDELFSKELGSFDLVVFQNFNFGPYSMRQYLPEIADFVRKGGGFVMVGGDLSFASGEYSGTPIEDILPVGLPSNFNRNLIDPREFRPVLTDAGERHPVMKLAFDPAANREIWETLPEQVGSNVVLEAKEDATVLATHPSLKAGGSSMPVVTVSEKGEGRVMAITTDSTWRWAFESLSTGGTPREYQVFWNGAMRWLIKDPELKLLRIDLADDRFSPGDTLEASIRVQKSDYTPAEDAAGEVVVTHTSFEDLGKPGVTPEVITRTSFRTDSKGLAAIEPKLERPGAYRISAQAETSAGELQDEDAFIVVPSVDEYRDILPRSALLEDIAEQTGGAHFALVEESPGTMIFTPPKTVQVNRRRVIHIWDSVPIFIFILLTLGTEWFLRRRWGRL